MTKPTRKHRLSRFVPDEKAFPSLTIRERDTEIIQIINEYRYLDFELLWQLLASKYGTPPNEYRIAGDGKNRPRQYGFTEQALRKRLMQLFNARYLNRQSIADEPIGRGYGSPRAIYSIGPKSADFISKLTGESIDRIRSVIKSDKKKPFFLRHALEISRFRATLELACRQSDGEIRLLIWKQGRQLMDKVTGRDADNVESAFSVFPDAFFTLSIAGQGKANFFLEIDRGTMSIVTSSINSDNRKKIYGYWYYWKSKRFADRYYYRKLSDGQIVDLGIAIKSGGEIENDSRESIKGFTVLFVTPGTLDNYGFVQGRIANIMMELSNLPKTIPASPLFWFSTPDKYSLDEPQSIFEEIWKSSNPKKGMRSLVDRNRKSGDLAS
jgi:hypothetical protein